MSYYRIIKEKGNFKKIFKINKACNLIELQKLFDEDFYLNKYPQIRNSKISPINHYIYHGYKEGKNPSKHFDGNYYLKKYPDIKKSGQNPLIHYVLYGKKEGRHPNKKIENCEEFKNYLSKLEELDEKSIMGFLAIFNRKLRKAEVNNELDSSLFEPSEWKILEKILKDHNTYYFKKYVPEEKYPEFLEDWYFKKTGNKLNLENPKTFNEKIQWLKLYDKNSLKTKLTDKYLVREWIKEKIGEKYLIPLIGVYNDFNEINFDDLPNKFVIKTNHGSAMNIIVKNKYELDKKTAKNKINKWLNINYAFKYGLELHYSDIKPKILIEEYIGTEDQDFKDYKILCFDGKPEILWVDNDRHNNHKRNVYDLEYNLLPVKMHSLHKDYPNFDDEKPKTLDKMIKLAKVLSKGFSHVRVDFYSMQDKIYFGEMTFTSGSGTEVILPEEFHKRLGDLINLVKI